jgi:hypothetical protein
MLSATERCEHHGRQLLDAVAHATGIWWLLYASHEVAVSVSYHHTHLVEEEGKGFYLAMVAGGPR